MTSVVPISGYMYLQRKDFRYISQNILVVNREVLSSDISTSFVPRGIFMERRYCPSRSMLFCIIRGTFFCIRGTYFILHGTCVEQ